MTRHREALAESFPVPLLGGQHSGVQSKIVQLTMNGFDGRFNKGKLKGKSVNVKFYPKRESFIDWRDDALPDYFLILAGPKRKERAEDQLSLRMFFYLIQKKPEKRL